MFCGPSSVLDALLDLTADLSSVPVPMGPEPVLYAMAQPVTAQDDGDNQPLSRDSVDEEEGGGGEDQPKTVAEARYRHILATGFCDVQVEGEESEDPDENIWNTFNRDVEWM